jgi:hypothetical protein
VPKDSYPWGSGSLLRTRTQWARHRRRAAKQADGPLRRIRAERPRLPASTDHCAEAIKASHRSFAPSDCRLLTRAPIRPHVSANMPALCVDRAGPERSDRRVLRQMIGVHCGVVAAMPEPGTLRPRNSDAQEGGGNGGGILARTFVLADEQSFQLFLQIARSTDFICGLECIHGRPVNLLNASNSADGAAG